MELIGSAPAVFRRSNYSVARVHGCTGREILAVFSARPVIAQKLAMHTTFHLASHTSLQATTSSSAGLQS